MQNFPIIQPTLASKLDLASIPPLEREGDFLVIPMSDGPHRILEREVVKTLTCDGEIPIEFLFLIGEWGAVAYWNPSESAVYYIRVRNNVLAGAMKILLKSIGQVQLSEATAIATAKAKKWLGWERLRENSSEV